MNILFASSVLKIIVYQKDSGECVAHGTFDGIDILNSLPLDSGDKCVFLLMANKKRIKFDNLVCVNKSGEILWQSNILSAVDFFVSIELNFDIIIANSWYGYRVLIDKDYGREISRIFVK